MANNPYRFENAGERWWQKPLAKTVHGIMRAELAVLKIELSPDEEGAWLKSRNPKRGTERVERISEGKYKTTARRMPGFVSNFLANVYESPELTSGCPDLVIWKESGETFRFVEVKCPHWDRLSKIQEQFITYARSQGIEAMVVEWVFEDHEMNT